MVPTSGSEWIVDAHGCRPDALRSRTTLEAVFDRVVGELALCPVAPPVWHQFPGEGGITGMALLSESHLTCHTFPEAGYAAFNLYSCRPRERWTWEIALAELVGAREVSVRSVERGTTVGAPR